jgi:hypothetical protein
MAASTKTWVNNSTPQCEDDDLNGFKLENNNLIAGSGQTLSTLDNQQTHKAVSHYAAAGDFYTAGGTANAITLAVQGAQVAPPVYEDGMRFRCRILSSNTAATTLTPPSLAAKNVFYDGAALSGGELVAGEDAEFIYDEGNDRFNADLTLTGSGVIENKVIGDTNTINAQTDAFEIQNASDSTKLISFTNGSASTGTGVTLDFNQTAAQTITFPVSAGGAGGVDHVAMSSTNTGGAGSAGVGNQYIEIHINGTTYKVLHDGTV